MTDIFTLGSIDLIATRYQTGSGEYDWEEHDEQPSYAFTFDPQTGCCTQKGGILTSDSLTYIVKPMTFRCFSAGGKTAIENRDALIAVLNGATAYSLKQTCNPNYTGSPVLMVRQPGDAAYPDVWTVRRYQRKRTRLDLDARWMTLDVDLYCVEGGPVIDPETGRTMIGDNGNPVNGGSIQTAGLRISLGTWTRAGADAPRSLGTWGNERLVLTAGSWTRTGGS